MFSIESFADKIQDIGFTNEISVTGTIKPPFSSNVLLIL
jgi:hypothetical protein